MLNCKVLRSAIQQAALILVLASCGGDNGEQAPTTPDLPPGTIASAIIGSQGGRVAVLDAESRYEGVAVDVPSGALAEDTQFYIVEEPPSDPSLPWRFRLEPSGLQFILPVTVTVRYAADWADRWLVQQDSDLLLVHHYASDDFEVVPASSVDRERRVISAEISSFSGVSAGTAIRLAICGGLSLSEAIYSYGAQQPNLLSHEVWIDEAEVPHSRDRTGRRRHVVGKATQDAPFWSTDSNAIVIHGIHSNATSMYPEDTDAATTTLVEGLKKCFDNVYVYQYPWLQGVRPAAAWLYAEIQAKAKPGFGVTILGHSMGGLVARWALERIAQENGDLPGVQAFVSIATPHEGAALSDVIRFAQDRCTTVSDRWITTQFVDDLSVGAGGIGPILNMDFSPQQGVPYYFVGGDAAFLTDCGDEVVSCASATGANSIGNFMPTSDSASRIFDSNSATEYDHDKCMSEAATNGVVPQVFEWLGHPSVDVSGYKVADLGTFGRAANRWGDGTGTRSRRIAQRIVQQEGALLVSVRHEIYAASGDIELRVHAGATPNDNNLVAGPVAVNGADIVSSPTEWTEFTLEEPLPLQEGETYWYVWSNAQSGGAISTRSTVSQFGYSRAFFEYENPGLLGAVGRIGNWVFFDGDLELFVELVIRRTCESSD